MRLGGPSPAGAGRRPDSRSLRGRAPDFFVVGAPKSGTTSLYHWLAEHPSVFMSPLKEPCFFAPEVVDYTPRSREVYEAELPGLRHWLDGPMTEPRDNGIILDWNDYLSLFRYAADESVAGEVSGNYLHSWNAPTGIRTRIPAARIVMLLRNPVDRLFSHYASALGAGEASGSFSRWIDEQELAEAEREPRFGPIWTGMYARHLDRYLSAFPADQVRVYLYDEYRDRPRAMMQDLFGFLGVAADHAVDVTVRFNVTTVPRWPVLHRWLGPAKPAIDALLPAGARARVGRVYRKPPRFRPTSAERVRLMNTYRSDILALQDRLGRDLSAWLTTG